MIELYGFLDMETRDWIDGLFSNIFREMNKPIEREVRKKGLPFWVGLGDTDGRTTTRQVPVPTRRELKCSISESASDNDHAQCRPAWGSNAGAWWLRRIIHAEIAFIQ